MARAEPAWKYGAIRSASSVERNSTLTPSRRASAPSRRMRASPSGVRITRIAPTRRNPTLRPVVASIEARVSTASCTSRTISSVDATFEVSPAARGDVWDPSSCRSSSTTSRTPRRARW